MIPANTAGPTSGNEKMRPTWFGSMGFDGNQLLLMLNEETMRYTVTDDEMIDDVANTHCYYGAIGKQSGNVYFGRIDEAEKKPKKLKWKNAKEKDQNLMLIATSREMYLIDNNDEKCSKMYKILNDNRGPIENPTKIDFPWPTRIVEGCGGNDFVVLRDRQGNIFTIGTGTRGELGVGLVRNVDEPVHVEQLAGIRIRKIVCGGWHTLALTDGGDVYTWGWNRKGQLGKNKMSTEVYPVLIDFREEFGTEEGVEIIVDEIEAGMDYSKLIINEASLQKTVFELGQI